MRKCIELFVVLALTSQVIIGQGGYRDGYREMLGRLADAAPKPLRLKLDDRKYSQSPSNWTVLSESPFAVATLAIGSQAGLVMGCTESGAYLISALWLEAGHPRNLLSRRRTHARYPQLDPPEFDAAPTMGASFPFQFR